jgi:hypothetical protein
LAATDDIAKHPEWDQEYSKQIREHTTSAEFLTDLVDHLPHSETIPTPRDVLGYIAGDPDHLTYSEDVHKYMRALAAASPRVKVFKIGETEEAREMILVAIAEESTIADLDRYKEITRTLSDPRALTDEEALRLIRIGKPIYYATGAMHSYETGSPEMLMELAYRLAVGESSFVREIRDNVIVLFTPVLEVDGRNRMVDLVRWYQENRSVGLPPLIYWGHYVAHDNNRDAIGLSLNLTRNVLNTFFDWHPQVIHDLHESLPFLYVSTGTGPYNAWLDPIAIGEWHRMAYHEVQVLTEKGLPGVWTHGFYSGWAPGYMFWIAHGHNAIGRFYETFGNVVPWPEDRVVRRSSQRAWYKPNPPYPTVTWSIRNNINYQQSGLMLALHYVAENRQHSLKTFWSLGKRAVAKPASEGPAAYVLDANQKRKGQLRDLLTLLQTQGIEVHRAKRSFRIQPTWPPKVPDTEPGKKPQEEVAAKSASEEAAEPFDFSSGSFIVRMDQPYSRFADTLLDTQYVRGEERLYDDSGWTLGYLKNVDVQRIVNPEVLKVPVSLWDGTMDTDAPLKGRVIAVQNVADTDLIRLRYALADVAFSVAEEEFEDRDRAWPPGTVLIPLNGEHSSRVREVLQSLDLSCTGLKSAPSIQTRDIPTPRIAILHTWLDTQNEGWYRLAFESLDVPYEYVSTQDVSGDDTLRDKYDVILFPPVGFEPQDIVNGLPPGPALPWKHTELTPHLGAVDETDDMRPGLGLSGVANLKTFVQEGGLLITVRDTAEWAVEYGLARWVEVVKPAKVKAAGSILKATFTDPRSPVSWGYDDTVPVYFAGAPVFDVGVFDDDDDEIERPSGRGSKEDPDVPQGRAFVEMPEKPKPGPGEKGFLLRENLAYIYKIYTPRIEDRPRVILSFPEEAGDILLSGMLEGAEEIAGKPVIIDSPLGKGHILLFAINPMWRMNTQGNYALVFNAILNYQNLNFGWPPEPDESKDTIQ